MKVRIIMRKHCARKWLHFTIDLLPFVVIPIFAIWGINHGDYNKDVEITYKYQTNEVSSADDLVVGNIYHFDFNNSTIDTLHNPDDDFSFTVQFVNITSFDFSDYGLTLEEIYYSFSGNSDFTLGLEVYEDYGAYLNFYYNDDSGYMLSLSFDYVLSAYDFTLVGDFIYVYSNSIYIEPFITSSTYNEIDSVDVVGVGIGEAFYNSIIDTSNKYFNFDNVFNFGELKEWFNVNFFSGSMPPLINVLFNVIFYEFITDIIMLIYTFFMFIIDFANDLLERPFSDIKRG